MSARLVISALVCIFLVVDASWAMSLALIQSTASDAHEAIRQKDYTRAKADYEVLLKEAPEHPAFQTGLARSLVGLGRKEEAQKTFESVIAEGYGAGILDDPTFNALHDLPGQGHLTARAKAQAVPLALAHLVFRIDDPHFVAEGMAFDPLSKRLFVSSTYLRKVIARNRDGRVVDFIPSADHGLLQVLGLKADPARHRLIVLTGADDQRYLHARPEEHNRTAVFVYDLTTGKFQSATWLGEAGNHLFNDLVVAPDGAVYLTDSTAGRLYRYSAGKLEPLTPADTLLYPNGVDLDDAKQLLYIADVRGVFVLDLATRKLSRINVLHDISTVSIDGLYLYRGWLVGVQSNVSPERVAAFKLSADGRSVIGATVLERVDPRLNSPTEGVVVGDELYFVANSNMQFVDDKGTVAAEATQHPVTILRLHLPGGVATEHAAHG